jgi:thioredoxin reductase (NADPH)
MIHLPGGARGLSQDTNSNDIVDIAVIGGGPAGLFAAFYAGMRQASCIIIESMPQLGGQLSALYPEKYIYDVAGFPKVRAQQLVDQLLQQMQHFPIKTYLSEKVVQLIKQDERHFVIQTNKGTYRAKAIVITAGVGAFEPRKLDLAEAVQYEGKNLHYFVNQLEQFRGRKVLISGGGDSAVDWSLMLEPIAEQVTLTHRRDKFRAHEHSVELLLQSKVNVLTSREITALNGINDHITSVSMMDLKTQATEQLDVDDVIVNHGFISSLGPIAEWGFEIHEGSIVVDSRMETSVPGIFAAGDITTYPGKLKLIAVGFGEAPTAINNAKVYIDPKAKLSPGHSSNMKF